MGSSAPPRDRFISPSPFRFRFVSPIFQFFSMTNEPVEFSPFCFCFVSNFVSFCSRGKKNWKRIENFSFFSSFFALKHVQWGSNYRFKHYVWKFNLLRPFIERNGHPLLDPKMWMTASGVRPWSIRIGSFAVHKTYFFHLINKSHAAPACREKGKA